jgi:hypothetical protein
LTFVNEKSSDYRHSGVDCRNPEAKDGIYAAWMPSFPDGMTGNVMHRT